MPPQLAAQPLALVTAKQLRDWRDGLLKADMTAPTLNRMLKGAKAAFNLAAKLDKRVRANAGEWKVGLEALPGTVTAREAVLTDAQVLRVVAAADDELPAFGLYVQVHAEVGARSSQLARLKVGDLQPGRLDGADVEERARPAQGEPHAGPVDARARSQLKAAAAGRSASAPLLLRPDGEPWRFEIADHRRLFERAARAAKLPEGSTIYSLRHSSITRALLRSVPIKVVADWHDTSTSQIEAHYGKFLKHHYDELVRAALIDTTPTSWSPRTSLRCARDLSKGVKTFAQL